MKFISIGGATAILEHKGKRFMFDPWLIEGIFHGAWFHYPAPKLTVDKIPHIDYLYISHIHEDHCHEGTLKFINKDCEVVIIDKNPNYVMSFLERTKLNFKKVHLVKENEPMILAPGLKVDLLTADPSHNLSYLVDSALVIEWDGFKIYNANDCGPHSATNNYILEKYGQVDLALLPYAAGSSYPSCFTNLTDEEKYVEKERIYQNSLNEFFKNVQILRPRFATPFADSYCIVGSNAHLNKYMPHPAGAGAVIEEAKKYTLESQIVVLNSMQSLDLETGRKSPDEDYCRYDDNDRESYIERHSQGVLYDYEKVVFTSSVPTKRILKIARDNMWRVQESENYFPNFRYYIKLKDDERTFVIDFAKNELAEFRDGEKKLEPYLGVDVPNTLLCMMMIGHISWNIADAALFIEYSRVPNIYEPKLFSYLNFLRI